MKSAIRLVVVGIAIIVTGLEGNIFAAAYETWSFTGDADSGISTSKTYTHAVNLAGVATTINGVNFIAGIPTGTNYTLTIPNLSSTGSGSSLIGQITNVVYDMYFAGGNQATQEILTLTGLAPDTKYKAVFYNRGWGSPGGRLINITDSQGGSLTGYDQNWAGDGRGNLLIATYKTGPAETSISLTFTSLNTSASFHQYGFSNETVTNEAANVKNIVIFADNFSASGTTNTYDLNYNMAGRQTGSSTNITYTGTGNTQVGNSTANIDGGNYLLTAANGKVSPNYNFNSSVPAPLTISFDMAPNITANVDTTVWAGICVGLSASYQTAAINAGNAFGILFRGNGQIQTFWGTADITTNGTGLTVWDGGSGSGNNTTNMSSFKIVISDLNGTGCGFGTVNTMIKVYAKDVLIHTYTTSGGGLAGGLSDNYINFQAPGTGVAAFDNLGIQNRFVLISPEGTNVIGSQSYTGDMVVAENATYEWDGNRTTGDTVNVAGQLTLPTNLTLKIQRLESYQSLATPLFTSQSISGNTDFSKWSITGTPVHARIDLASGSNVVLRIFQQGTILKIQ